MLPLVCLYDFGGAESYGGGRRAKARNRHIDLMLNNNCNRWQKGGMRVEDIAWIEETSRALEQEPIRLEFLEEALVA